MMKRIFLFLLFSLAVTSTAYCAPITFENVTGYGRYWTDWREDRTEGGDLGILTDGYIPPPGSPWYQNTVVFGPRFTAAVSPDEVYQPVYFVFDIGSLYNIENIIISVDNNDNYHVIYSTDGTIWNPLFVIDRVYGSVDEFDPGGSDIFSTIAGAPYYEPLIDFSPVTAQYLAVFASGHDWGYSISEFQAFGTPVPEPSTMMLLGFGLLSLVGIHRSRMNK